ncbi:hypothetical protein M0R72_05150 [Candidatus Pacearchaeota archaeon]|jgi:uncharacterized membrane protein|nr:hypothetical protein [Candidatus Pacearchaeota archaeon]
MFKEMIFLQTGTLFSGGQIGTLLTEWEQAGVFDYMLPFLLIFALVFGLLSKVNIFGGGQDANKGKGINAIIAVAVALMALQFGVVSDFFAEIFPRMGVALSIILVLLVVGGLFIPTNKENNWFLVVLSVIVFIIIATVVFNSMDALGWLSNIPWLENIWNQYGSIIIFVAVIIAVIVVATREKNPAKPKMENALSKLLGA